MWNIGNVMLIGPGEVLVGQVLEGLHEGLQTSHGQDGGLWKTTEKKKEAWANQVASFHQQPITLVHFFQLPTGIAFYDEGCDETQTLLKTYPSKVILSKVSLGPNLTQPGYTLA